MTTINLSASQNEEPGRRIQQTISDATATDWIVLDSVNPGETITVALVITTGEGTIQYTAEDVASLVNGAADGVEWSKGSVTTTTYGYFPSGITGVKFVRTSGTIKGCIAV